VDGGVELPAVCGAGRGAGRMCLRVPGLLESGRGILFEICVRKAFRRQGLAYALAARLYLALMREGCTEASYTLVLDDNWASRRTAEKLGALPARNFVTYEKRRSVGQVGNLPTEGSEGVQLRDEGAGRGRTGDAVSRSCLGGMSRP